MPLKKGMIAPSFSLPDQKGKTHSLRERKGKWTLVYFYPKDDTPGCTIEACTIRDAYPKFARRGVKVFGVSADTEAKHAKFAQKHELPFTLLSDTEKTMLKAYKAWGKKKFMGREYMGIHRMSYLIDPKGRIAKVYPTVKVSAHAEEVLADLTALKKDSG